ncbi:hypothetical protein Tco_0441389 [Tanacetum coccineum]
MNVDHVGLGCCGLQHLYGAKITAKIAKYRESLAEVYRNEVPRLHGLCFGFALLKMFCDNVWGKSMLSFANIKQRTISSMSDSEVSTVTYTELSSPYKDLSDVGSPRVEGPIFQDPPSLDYVPGPEKPEQAPPSPIYIPFVPEPVLLSSYQWTMRTRGGDEERSEEDPVDSHVTEETGMMRSHLMMLIDEEEEENLGSCQTCSYCLFS